MPRGSLSKDEMKIHVLKLKMILSGDHNHYDHPKDMANHYLNLVLDKIDEYAR